MVWWPARSYPLAYTFLKTVTSAVTVGCDSSRTFIMQSRLFFLLKCFLTVLRAVFWLRPFLVLFSMKSIKKRSTLNEVLLWYPVSAGFCKTPARPVGRGAGGFPVAPGPVAGPALGSRLSEWTRHPPQPPRRGVACSPLPRRQQNLCELCTQAHLCTQHPGGRGRLGMRCLDTVRLEPSHSLGSPSLASPGSL